MGSCTYLAKENDGKDWVTSSLNSELTCWSQNSEITKIEELRNIGFEVASKTQEQEAIFTCEILV